MDGKYVIKMGDYYISSAKQQVNSIDIVLERELRDARLMGLKEAIFIKGRVGGKVLKISLDLEEVNEQSN